MRLFNHRHKGLKAFERFRANAAWIHSGFTLIELLVSITILAVLMVLVTNVVTVVQRTWVRSNARVSEFREARTAFEVMTRNLKQATLNSYWQNDFDILATADAAGLERNKAKSYKRNSELQFVCGKVSGGTGLLPTATAADFPGHGVFFQAPLGITNLTTNDPAHPVNTESMVNLLCGRGYFVQWGDDESFRPSFLTDPPVRKRFRYRLMEYSPTAESNQIYASKFRPLVPDDDVTPKITGHSKEWFQADVLTSVSATAETVSNRAFTRPVADNIIVLVISPQVDTRSDTTKDATWIAPQYEYDSTLKQNPGVAAVPTGSQGTQNLLPPILKLTMVAIDSAAAERLAETNALRTSLSTLMQTLFVDAKKFNSDDSQYQKDLASLTAFLIQNRLNYRVFTTAVDIKEAHWSL